MTGLKIAEVFDEAGLPPGLLSVVPGLASEVGAAIFADPRVRMITFTGSTQTGRHLAVEAAKTLKRFTLEMGGKSPLIVLGDADVDYAARAAAFGIFFHQGQVCMANSRILDEAHAPFGGVKNSGFGREGGRFSMEEMTELKWITIQSGQRAFPM